MLSVATDSILGRATAATGNVEVLTALPFAYTGDVTRPADSNVTTIANNAVTNAKSAQMAANTVKSNATAGTADPSDLAVGTNTVVGRVAGNIVAAQLVNDQITNSTIQYAKIQNVSATSRFLGRVTAGAGVIEELTNTQAKTVLAIANTDVSGLGTMSTQNASSVAITGGTAVFNNSAGLAVKDSDSSHNLIITTSSNITANRTLTLVPGDSDRTLTMTGNATLNQAVDTTASPTFVNENLTGYENYTAISVPATPSSGNVRLSARTEVGRTCLRMLCDEGIDADIQSAFYHRAISIMGVTNGTTNPTTLNCNGQFTATMSYAHTVASANPWLATRRKRHTTSTVAGNQSGWRINYAMCYRGNAAGYGGFYYVQKFGHNLNLNGSQYFAGLAGLTTALPATAGAVAALTDMIGVGYDTTDSSAGNWQFFRNDNAGTATKVDLGSSALRSNVSHGYWLTIFLLPNSNVFNVRITNIHDGTVLLNTTYNTDVPTANVGLCPRVEVNNGAVAAAADCDHSFMYIATNY